MLHALHMMDIKYVNHKSRLRILVYHHFVSIIPSDWTNRAYLKMKNIICNSNLDKNDLIDYYCILIEI